MCGGRERGDVWGRETCGGREPCGDVRRVRDVSGVDSRRDAFTAAAAAPPSALSRKLWAFGPFSRSVGCPASPTRCACCVRACVRTFACVARARACIRAGVHPVWRGAAGAGGGGRAGGGGGAAALQREPGGGGGDGPAAARRRRARRQAQRARILPRETHTHTHTHTQTSPFTS